MNWKPGLRARHLLVVGAFLICTSNAATIATAATPFKSGQYAAIVYDGGFTFHFTWTITVSGGSISGTSTNAEYGFVDPLTGSASGTGATIIRSCGPLATQRYYPNCGSQTYVLQAGAGGVYTGTGTGFGVVAGTTITMQLGVAPVVPPPPPTPAPPSGLPPLPDPPAANRTGRIMDIQLVGRRALSTVTVTRGGKKYQGSKNSLLQTGDIITTDDRTIAALEFAIGGRVGINADTSIQLINDRAVGNYGISIKRVGSNLLDAALFVTPFGSGSNSYLKQPIEIQTNGGVMGIRG